jgi:outer membrane protein OmpA-like peptidoglycan-associated protein
MIVAFFLIATTLFQFGSEEIGTTAFPILRQGFGPRPSALGESFVALSDDATASWWNPAGLGAIEQNFIYFSHQEWFLDTRDEYVSGVVHTPYGTFSPAFIYSGIEDVEAWTEDEEQLTSFSTSTAIIHLAYGGSITENLFLGGGLKGIYDNLHTVTATGGCIDIGVLYRLNDWISFGGTVQNIGPSIHYITTSVSLPRGARIGTHLCYGDNLQYLMDVNVLEKGKPELHTGIEYTFLGILSLRAGFRTGPQSSTLGFFTYGTGINWHRLGIDYAFVPYSVLGSTHRISLSYSFKSLFETKKRHGVTILVLDAYTNVPLKALIEFEGTYTEKEWTDPTSGEFHREFFPEGKTKFSVSKHGYATTCDSFVHHKKKHTLVKVLLRKPMPSAIIGVIYDAVSREPISGKVSYSGTLSGSASTKTGGDYEIGSLTQGSYSLTASSSGYIDQTKEIYVGSGELKEQSFYLLKSEGPLVLKDIHFDTGKADLRKEAFEILKSVGLALKENPSYRLKIEGHTDVREIHTKEFPSNWELSRARATSAKNYIVENFTIDPDRIETEGFADTRPVASNDTEENLQKNRRVEFFIIK